MTYDYIIVGAGSAGCLLANRLSADPSVHVLLVEAGGRDTNPWIHVPAGSRSVVGNPKTDWCFETEIEPELGRKGPVLRGKVLGGSSSINGTVYTRGATADYDHWRQLGLAGWSWQDVEPFFRRHERFADGGDCNRGGDGELHIERPRLRMRVYDILERAAAQAGLPEATSFNGGEPDGVGSYEVTQRRGLRQSSAKAFLEPVRGRGNLDVLTQAHCLGLVLDGSRATGARLRCDDAVRTVAARREVILSAGAIGTPQILQLSGIGPGSVLSAAGVEVVLDKPAVGANLQDHLSMRLAWKIEGVATVNTLYHNVITRALMAAEFALRRSGPMVLAAPLWGGYLRSTPEREMPNVQMFVLPATFSAATSFSTPDRFDGVSCGIYNMHPRSRGHVRITSSDPAVQPGICHNYLADPEDRKVALESIALGRRLAAQPAFAALRPEELRPGADLTGEEDLVRAMKAGCGTAYHQIGTCAMGPRDADALDERLRFRGIEALRVVDGSVMPTLISGNTNAPIMMIAEKAAAMIAQDT